MHLHNTTQKRMKTVPIQFISNPIRDCAANTAGVELGSEYTITSVYFHQKVKIRAPMVLRMWLILGSALNDIKLHAFVIMMGLHGNLCRCSHLTRKNIVVKYEQ